MRRVLKSQDFPFVSIEEKGSGRGRMMAERRYGVRFNGVEGGLLLGGVLLASFLIFVSGVYVGREVAGRKGVAQT